MQGHLIPEVDVAGNETGARICLACANLACWHWPSELCVIDECDCQLGTEYADGMQRGASLSQSDGGLSRLAR
jgi:hypothetical protein